MINTQTALNFRHPSPLYLYMYALFRSQIKNGLPAVLVYRRGELVGNLLRVTDSLGEDFSEGDVEGFLQE